MSDQPAVSVVIVNSGRREELALALTGLRYQRYPNLEVIVVTDAPEAERPEVPYDLRWISFAERNISAARNLGIAAARGEIVAFCDDDAVPEFGWLDALIAPFAKPEVGAAGGYTRGRNGVNFQWRAQMVDRLGRDRRVDPGPEPRVYPGGGAEVLKTVGTNCAFRREALVAVGGFDEAFRFFLDETDLNHRLSAAGWAAAIVPQAEVHHGFAASALRSHLRVPRSLFEIGASLSHFLEVHAPAKARAGRLAEFRAEQARRLDRHFLLGNLQAGDVRRLMAELEDGMAEGRQRRQNLAPLAAGDAGFTPAIRQTTGKRRLFTLPPDGAEGAKAAAEAARNGDEVTLIVAELGPRNLDVKFTASGYFCHHFGTLGKAERDKPRPLGSREARIFSEVQRILSQRGPFSP